MGSVVQRLVACFDGTWNTERSNTNVSRLFRQIADEHSGCAEQRRYYDEGVGTGWGERLRGGLLGAGLDRNIRQGYAWLATQFEQCGAQAERDADGFCLGPQIFLFGFSRGAFTARSLGGLINTLGLPRGGDAALLERAWTIYASRPTPQQRDDPRQQARVAAYEAELKAFRSQHCHWPVRIHFLGVWDTVGALGIPRLFDDWALLPRFSSKYRFHDTRLGRCVRHAFHAVAIDEHRAPYAVTLWSGEQAPTTEQIEQRWFPGAHADVGGGYDQGLLAEPPLAWIAAKAADQGLRFNGAAAGALPPPFLLDGQECLSPVHDSYAAFMAGAYRWLRALPGAGGRAYRRMLVAADGLGQSIDASVAARLAADADYRPPNLAQAGRVEVGFNVADAAAGERA